MLYIVLLNLSFFIFRLYPFPTRGTDPENRRKWQQLINRQDKKGKLWSPSKDSRVCSRHFKEGRPTEECPYPTENLSYDSTSKVANILQPQKRRRIHRHTLVSLALGKNVKENELNSEDSDSGCYIQSQGDNETLSPSADPESASEPAENQSQRESEPSPDNNIDARPDNESSGFLNNFVIIVLFLKLITSFTKLSSDVTNLTAQVKRLQWQKKQNILKIRKLQEELRKCTCNQLLHSNLLKTDEDVQFYTGLQSKGMFDSLHDFIAPFVKRRWKGVSRVVNKVRRPIFQQQKQRGPQRKLPSKDEFLLTMKRLKLALLHLDLAKRFKISRTLSGRIFNSWLRAMSTVLRPMIYMPEQGVINITSPKRFHGVRNVHSIIDCSELFMIMTYKQSLGLHTSTIIQ